MANAIPDFPSFARALAGTPMAGEARGIYNAAIKGGLNPAFVAGLAMAESSGGKAGYAVGTHNPYGLGVHLGWKFGNYAAATAKLAKTLNSLGYPDLYKKSGLRGVIGQYTPWGDASNNPNGHTANITQYGNKTGGNAAVVYTNGQGAPVGGQEASIPATGGGSYRDYSALLAMSRQQADNLRSGAGYDQALADKFKAAIIDSIQSGTVAGGSAAAAGAVGGAQPIPRTGSQTKLSKWGGPSDHAARALGNWQSDMAYDLGAKAGTSIYAPMSGKVVRISGHPGGNPQFAGYGITVDFGGGKQAFFKHLGSKNPGLSVGSTVQPGTLIGGLDPSTNGGPHLHLGANSNSFLNQILSFYT